MPENIAYQQSAEADKFLIDWMLEHLSDATVLDLTIFANDRLEDLFENDEPGHDIEREALTKLFALTVGKTEEVVTG